MRPRRSTGGTSSPRASSGRSWQNPDPDAAELDLVTVILQADVPFARFAIEGHRAELAFCDAVEPFRAAELVLEKLGSVEPVFDVVPVDEQARGIPFTRRANDSSRSFVQREVGSGRSER